jgi:hypothetical protein
VVQLLGGNCKNNMLPANVEGKHGLSWNWLGLQDVANLLFMRSFVIPVMARRQEMCFKVLPPALLGICWGSGGAVVAVEMLGRLQALSWQMLVVLE